MTESNGAPVVAPGSVATMIEPQARGIPVTSIAELEAIVGPPAPTAANKTRDRLHEVDLAWLAAAPLAFGATSDEHGNLDVAP